MKALQMFALKDVLNVLNNIDAGVAALKSFDNVFSTIVSTFNDDDAANLRDLYEMKVSESDQYHAAFKVAISKVE